MGVGGFVLLKKFVVLASLGVLLGAAGFLLYSRLGTPSRDAAEVSQAASREAARKLTELTSPSPVFSQGVFEFSEREINSYLRYQVSALYPKGLDEVRVRILDDAVRAKARVNFDDLQAGIKAGKVTVMSSLFSGVHEVELAGKLSARNGGGSYEILGVSLDQIEIPKPLIDLLVKRYLVPKYPDAAPDKVFALPYRIDRIECLQGKIAIYRRRG
jgi:hypothetical protein